MTPEQAENYRFDILDITKVWPHRDFLPIKIGKLVLNRNPTNYFAEVEQAAFNPSNLVPGIGISPDKMLQARVFSYHETHIHRLGPNYHLIPVNAPKSTRLKIIISVTDSCVLMPMVAAGPIIGQIVLVVLFQILVFWNPHSKYRDSQAVRLIDTLMMTLYSQAICTVTS